MSVPAYASDLDEKTYKHWRDLWPYKGDFGREGYRVEGIRFAQDAAALISIIAFDARVRKTRNDMTPLGLECDGYYIEPVAAMLRYHREEAGDGLEYIIDNLHEGRYGLNNEDHEYLLDYAMECVYRHPEPNFSSYCLLQLCNMAHDIDVEGAAVGISRPLPLSKLDDRLKLFAKIHDNVFSLSVLAQHEDRYEAEDQKMLQQKCVAGAMRFLEEVPHDADGSVFLKIMNDYASDLQIVSFEDRISRMYGRQLKANWGRTVSSAKKEKKEPASILRDAFERQMGPLEEREQDAVGIVMTGWHTSNDRLIPGNGLLDPIDLKQYVPDLVALNWAPPEAMPV